ncbi:MAG: tRNA 2-selenouridine(34) synthase MnmH [Bacteroidetes bacterium]|nr:tRNA 2-selenouridine(34) synthase MnmH [Bacteroidota bacterium]
MANNIISADDYISQIRKNSSVILDTRSEAEYEHAHIPGSVNLPLLNNEERVVVGTLYKQEGREAAIDKGFEIVKPKSQLILERALQMAPEKELMLYCWRGGMRSNLMSSFLEINGFHTNILEGGYKAFRNWVIGINSTPRNVLVLGGGTGSGKTVVLKQLGTLGEQVLDLEELASHRGSAFGALGLPPQPSNEQFENLIAMQWSRFTNQKPIWIENESRSVGSCILPENIYSLIRTSTLIAIDIGIERRKQHILEEYGCYPAEQLIAMARKIEKRMGPQHLKSSIEFFQKGDINSCLDLVLEYYDKMYVHGNAKRAPDSIHTIDLTSTPWKEMGSVILMQLQKQKLIQA